MLEPRTHTEHKGRRAPRIPETMPAAAIDHFGGPEVLTAHVLQVPKVSATEVLIALDTAGVGPWDANIRAGWYPGRKPKFPLVLGTDGAGVVAEVGSRVRRFKIGDTVYSYSWANPKAASTLNMSPFRRTRSPMFRRTSIWNTPAQFQPPG